MGEMRSTDGSADGTAVPVVTRATGEGAGSITYDVRGDLSCGVPLLLFGAPMDASGFRQLAGHFPDRPVVTFDPRGAGRNSSGTGDITTDQHADDIHRVIDALGVGPVDAFGSSGGAVNLLALAATHPEDLRIVVAHEPPSAPLLPDGDRVLAVVNDMKRTYDESGDGAATAKFVRFVMFEGQVPADYLTGPAPDPAAFGMSALDDGSRTNPLFRNMPAIIAYRPDVQRLRAFGGRLVLAAGVGSGRTFAARAANAIAEQIGQPLAQFPSHHAGFVDQPGFPGDPAGFAQRLREILTH